MPWEFFRQPKCSQPFWWTKGNFMGVRFLKWLCHFRKGTWALLYIALSWLLPSLWAKRATRCYRFKRNETKYNESIGTQMSDVGNVCKWYSLSKDNTHSTVSSHHSKEVREFKRIHQKQGGQPWKREEHMTRERLATSAKKESEIMWWNQRKYWMAKRKFSRNLPFLFWCNTKTKELESSTFQTINLCHVPSPCVTCCHKKVLPLAY